MELASAIIMNSSSASYLRGEPFFIEELTAMGSPSVEELIRLLADSRVFADSDDWRFLPNRVNQQELHQEDLAQPFYFPYFGTSSLA